MDASLVYGSVCNKLTYNGATDPSDWEVFNTTAAAAIPVLTVTENPNGTYNLTFAAQTALDEVTVQVSKDGFSSNLLSGIVLL